MSLGKSLQKPPLPGALVISLDFELHWGVRDHTSAHGTYRSALLKTREVVPQLLEIFRSYEVAATWATVGFLFARSRDELESYSPSVQPVYRFSNFNPYSEPLGVDETADPLHFAPSLINHIRAVPHQEIATHTFSHFFCGESGADPESFRADIRAAVAIAGSRGIELTSIVFPRHQSVPECLGILRDVGITVYRGNPRGGLWAADAAAGRQAYRRIGRLVDSYVPLSGDDTFRWEETVDDNGLTNVPASRFLRPYSSRLRALEGVRFQRIARSIKRAARNGRIYHLWWHPHNFGTHTEENLALLRRLCDVFSEQREREGMESLTMADVATVARRVRPGAGAGQPGSKDVLAR